MFRDPIVEETRKAGETYAARFGFDMKKMFADLARRGKVRRAKLYYLRDLRGKAARIKEKDTRNKAQTAK